MTDLQVKYWANVENERANRAREAETFRSNQVKEAQNQARIAFQNQLDQARAEEAAAQTILNNTKAWQAQEEAKTTKMGRITKVIDNILGFPERRLDKMIDRSESLVNTIRGAVSSATTINKLKG